MPMKVLREHVESVFDNLWDVEVRMEYSGRGMYGKSCLGVVTEDAFSLAASLGGLLRGEDDALIYAEEVELVEYLLTHAPSFDSLGLSSIYYWPGLQVIED